MIQYYVCLSVCDQWRIYCG